MSEQLLRGETNSKNIFSEEEVKAILALFLSSMVHELKTPGAVPFKNEGQA